MCAPLKKVVFYFSKILRRFRAAVCRSSFYNMCMPLCNANSPLWSPITAFGAHELNYIKLPHNAAMAIASASHATLKKLISKYFWENHQIPN